MDKCYSKEMLERTVQGLSDERILEVASELYDYHATGSLREDSFVREIADMLSTSARDVEDSILDELEKRYRKVAILLINERTRNFLAKY